MIKARLMKGAPGERGAILVETVLTMTAFLLLIFGIAEAGRLLQVQNMLTNAAREGARFGITPLAGTMPGALPSDSEVRTVVRSFLHAGAVTVPDSSIVVSRSDITASPAYTTVTITCPYSLMTGLFPHPVFNLIGSSSMRNETSR
jgi:Flp pilus assembly protein TadG